MTFFNLKLRSKSFPKPFWQSPSFSAQLKLAQKLGWMIDNYSFSDSGINVKGWILSPFEKKSDARFLINDTVIVEAENIYFDPQLQCFLLPDLPESSYRFSLSFSSNPRQLFNSISFLPAGEVDTRDVFLRSWHFPAPSYDSDPLPEGDNIHRVIGNRSADMFCLGGATVANRINIYLQRTSGKDFRTIGNVLDWGCGCARVSRYARKLGCDTITGVDVDRTNVDWCKANLPWFSVQLSELAPPLPFSDRTFDLIYGISIFTHLRERLQLIWLAELSRVLKPGGIAIMTIMGEAQAALQGSKPDMIAEIGDRGFVVTDDNDQLRLGEEEENYYVNVYHSAKYIFREWGNFFKILDIVPFIGAHQDAVVLQKV